MAGKNQDISKKMLDKAFVRYAEIKNFKAVSRELNISFYILSRRWKALSEEKQEHYLSLARKGQEQAIEKYMEQNSVKASSYIESVITLRNLLLDKLLHITFKINANEVKNILIIKEAANALKSITSIAEQTEGQEGTSALDKLIAKIKEESIINN